MYIFIFRPEPDYDTCKRRVRGKYQHSCSNTFQIHILRHTRTRGDNIFREFSTVNVTPVNVFS